MAKIGMQEKFQIIMPPAKEKHEWTDLNASRRVAQDQANSKNDLGKFNELPPGEDIMAQTYVERFVDGGLAGETSVTDHVSSSLKKGYTRGDMSPSEEQYGGESIDLWYGESVDEDGNVGFMERNNYLDRQ
jgi:hypothetical protein